MPQKYKFEISPNSCAINNKNSTQKNKNTTCYSKESLELMANKLNETNEKKIKIKNKSKKKIWDEIQENFYLLQNLRYILIMLIYNLQSEHQAL